MSEITEKWFDELMAKAKERLDGVANAGSRRAASSALSVLEQNKKGLVALGESNVMEFLGLLGRGEKLRAKEFFIEKTQDPDALIAAMESGADAIASAPDVDWTKVATSILVNLGEIGAKTALAFLIGLI